MGSIGLANRLGWDIEGAFNDHVVHVLKSVSIGKNLTVYSYCSIVCNSFSVMQIKCHSNIIWHGLNVFLLNRRASSCTKTHFEAFSSHFDSKKTLDCTQQYYTLTLNISLGGPNGHFGHIFSKICQWHRVRGENGSRINIKHKVNTISLMDRILRPTSCHSPDVSSCPIVLAIHLLLVAHALVSWTQRSDPPPPSGNPHGWMKIYRWGSLCWCERLWSNPLEVNNEQRKLKWCHIFCKV